MTFCQNFHWLLFSPKKTKNKWHLNQNAALSKTLVRQSPSNRFTSLSLQLWMNHWSFTNMHNSFCAGGKGVKVDIINILYVNFSFFSWGGVMSWDVLARNYPSGKTRKNQENMFSFLRIKVSFHGNVSGSIHYVSLQSLAFQTAFLAMSKTWLIAIFEDPFFLSKKKLQEPRQRP